MALYSFDAEDSAELTVARGDAVVLVVPHDQLGSKCGGLLDHCYYGDMQVLSGGLLPRVTQKAMYPACIWIWHMKMKHLVNYLKRDHLSLKTRDHLIRK